MPFYAHAILEVADSRYPVGAALPDDLPGLDQLVEQGAAGPDLPVVEVAAGDGGVSVEESA